MRNAHRLERALAEIREREHVQLNESIDEFMKRTWQMALARLEQDTPELPRVGEARHRTERLLSLVGTPEVEKEND
jgi:hypothetical protein